MELLDILVSPTALIVYFLLIYSYVNSYLASSPRDHQENKVSENF